VSNAIPPGRGKSRHPRSPATVSTRMKPHRKGETTPAGVVATEFINVAVDSGHLLPNGDSLSC
jgi:hypothetical protein